MQLAENVPVKVNVVIGQQLLCGALLPFDDDAGMVDTQTPVTEQLDKSQLHNNSSKPVIY